MCDILRHDDEAWRRPGLNKHCHVMEFRAYKNNNIITSSLPNPKVTFVSFQVVKRAALITALIAGIGGAFTVLKILKKDLKVFWEPPFLISTTINVTGDLLP